MLTIIKKAILKHYNLEEHKGIFLSGFSKSKSLVFSQGLVETKEPLRVSLDNLYENFVKNQLKHIAYIVIDIVTEVIEINNPADMLNLSPQEYGFIVADTEDNISGVLLPNTTGVVDAKSALYDLKKKWGIHGKVVLSAFRTERMVVAK